MQVLNKCQNRKVGPYHPDSSVWCPKCIHYSLIDTAGVCQCCYFKIGINKKSYPNMVQFEKIAQANNNAILAYIESNTPEDLMFYWPIQLGIQKYLVPVKYLEQYLKMNDIAEMRRLLESVRKHSQILPRYIAAVR
jgi:hypothetical protein